MTWRLLLAVLAIAPLASGQQQQHETCLSVDDEPFLHFGTKTAYIFANPETPNQRVHDVPGCTPMALWLLNSHGSHNMEANEIQSMHSLGDLRNNILENYRRGNYRNFHQKLCSADLNLLERWQWNPKNNLTYAGNLTMDGYMSTQRLAQAWRHRFPGIMTNNRHDYLFRFINDQRSRTSFKAFTEGLFKQQAERMDIANENDEKLLRPYKFCPAWTKEVGDNNDTLTQRYIFESKREYKEMILNISQRLGFNWELDRDTVLRMYEICRYSKAWDVSVVSIWCAMFDKDDLRRLEYAEDLETYYKYGYGSQVNQKVGCTLVKDMMDFLTTHVEREPPQQPRALILFTDAPMILMTLTAMIAHRDSTPLTGDNYHSNSMQRRQWRSSLMAPFNANLGAALYKCTTNGKFQIEDQYQVLFLENENPMNIEGCRVGLCGWSHIKHVFGDVASRCDLNFCNGADSKNYYGFSLIVLVWFLKFVS